MLARRLFEHHFWTETRQYSRAEAWLDLLQTAAYAPHKRMIAGNIVDIPRGGLVASVRWLSDRWKWSNTKVCLFLDTLEAENMIARKKRQQTTLINICKYDVYNKPPDGKTTEKRQEPDKETTPGRHRDDEIEEGKEGKQTTTTAPPCPDVFEPEPQWLAMLEHNYPDRDVSGELTRFQQFCKEKGTAASRRGFEGWIRKASPAIRSKRTPAQSKFSFSAPVYDDLGRMIRNASGQDLNPETGNPL
jgi:hypothetical protein